jgi:hypothetical protein
MRACVYGRLPGALADAGAAPARRRGGGLEIFRRRQLFAKSSKCEFGLQELGFLGHRHSKEGVSVDQRNVQFIVELPTLTSCTEALRFTGLINYYLRFVEGYAELAGPLTALSCPTARDSRGLLAFMPTGTGLDALKLALSSAPVLSTFDPARRAVLTTDANNRDVAIAAILTQPDDEGHQHPVAYESRDGAELPGAAGCSAATCWAAERFDRRDFDLRTDNQAIMCLTINRHLNQMFARWLDEIKDFRFDETHLPVWRNPMDGCAVALRLRRRRRPCRIDGRRRRREPAGALLAAGQ